jgi:two-component system sensor histidine kinase AlgZ
MNQYMDNTRSFLPDFCNARTVFVVILLAELLAIILTLAQPPYVNNPLVDLAMHSLFIQWVALSCTGVLCLLRGRLRQSSDQSAAIISYTATLAITFIIAELAWWILSREAGYSYPRYGHGAFMLRAMGISAIVWALALRYFYIQNQWRGRVESESEARFQALQARIKPHFLFNCMNTIAGLIRRNPALAEEAIEDLADLFRASLQNTHKTCPLRDEIALCKRYLNIEQHRLGSRLTVTWLLESVPQNIQLPVLSIQPLLENAIYHGIEPAPEGGNIIVHGENQGDEIAISIVNPLHHDSGNPPRAGNRLALDNIRQRLASCFKKDNLLRVEQNSDNFRVTIIIPRLP